MHAFVGTAKILFKMRHDLLVSAAGTIIQTFSSMLALTTLKYFCINHGDQRVIINFKSSYSFHLALSDSSENLYVMGLQPC